MSPLRPSELDAFTAAVTASSTVRVPLDTLLALWADAVPRLVGEPESIPALVATLNGLAERGDLDLLAGSWDRSNTPAAPKFVTIAAARRTRGERPWIRFPWGSELGWASSLKTLSPQRFGQLAPQSTPASEPFFTPSVHVAWRQVAPTHTPVSQSPPPVHGLPTPHALHEPPQSTSVSEPFLTRSLHFGAAHFESVHTPLRREGE